jgi:hypothetical protein
MASPLQRTVAADGTLIEGSTMMSPLLQAAQAHFVDDRAEPGWPGRIRPELIVFSY